MLDSLPRYDTDEKAVKFDSWKENQTDERAPGADMSADQRRQLRTDRLPGGGDHRADVSQLDEARKRQQGRRIF